MSKHTKGPWSAEGLVIVDFDGQQVASVLEDHHNEGVDEADARLIAAVPELLAACELAANVALQNNLRHQFPEMVELLSAAIRKAKGDA